MEDQGGGIADGGGVYTDFAPEQEYALQGIVELGDGSHPLQDGGCFGADVEVLVTSAVSGQSSNPLGQPGLGDAQQTVTLEVTVASTQELPESSQGGDGKALSAQTSQRHEKTKAVDNQPGALIQTEGLCYCLKCYENFEDQDHLTDHLRSHTVATNRLRSPSSGDGARSREKRSRLARRKQNVVGAGSGRGTCGEELSPAQAVKEHDVSCCSGHGDGGERPGHQGDGSAVKAVFCPYRTCRLTFLTSVEMDEHLCDHYPFRCDRCDVMCSSAKLLAQHKKHRCLKTKIFKCELCSFESCGPRDLNKHYSVKHRDKATYACNRCDFISRYRKVLKKHLTMHSDESAEENYEQEERTQEPDNSSFLAQAWPGNQKPSACEEGGLVSETGSEGERSKKNKSFKQRHFKVDVQEGMEHLYKTHICPECKRCFKKRTHLVEHLHLHFPDPSLQCPHCQKFFTSKGKLKVHLMRELGEKTHHCPLCDYSAVEKNSLNRHMASMHENTTNFYSEVYSCPACEEKFTVSNALKEHMKSHKEERRPLDCFEGGCSYTAEERKDFVRHLKQVHGARAVECRYRTCGSLFGSESGMEAHRRTHYAFHCDQCDFVCSNKHVFRRHKRRGHPGSEELACGFCPYKTFNPVDFNDHVGKMHANEKIHKCSECDFATAHKRVLNRHILLHTGEKPHKCELCDFTCRDVGYLSKHRLTHSDDKNYMCTECGYITKWKHYLTVHMRKHTGDLRYHCNQCSYRCHRADQLSSHKLRHQGKSLICEVCGFACKRKYELQKHMQVKHSKDYQMPLHHCQYCSYQTQYKQALLNHENCKHTKLKEFRCALCSYKTFSNTSLFFHKRKVHGYVPGDKDWLENYAKEEMAMNSTQSLLAYSEASLSSAAKSEMAAPPSRNEVQQSEGEEFEKAHQPNVGASAFGRGLLQPGEVSRSRAPLPEEEPLGQHLAYSAKVDGTPEPGENCPDPEKGSNGNSSRLEEVFDAQLGFPSAPAEDMAKQIFVSQLPPLDCWAPCDTGTMYRDLGLNATDIVQADIGNDETDAEHCEEEEDQIVGSQEEVGHNIDVFMEDNQDAGYELSDKTGEPSRKIDDTSASGKANVTCASVAGPQLPQPTDGDNGSPEPQEGKPSGQGSPGGREEDLLSQSELEIKALRKQDKQQAQALVLEGRVQMLVVQTDAQVFKCEGCSYITRKEKAMVLHTKSGCQSRKMPLVCTACGATFKQLRGLSTHVQKKCPVILKKHKLYTRQATVKLPATRLDGEAEPAADARAEGVPVLSKGEDQQVNIGQRKQREPGLDADKPTQLLSKTASVSGVELRDQDAAQPVRVPEEGNIAQVRPAAGEEGDVFRTLAEKALDVASLLNGESLPSSPGEVERSQQELGTAKFTFAQGKYSCASCPFTCSSKLAISSHVAGGCPAPLKLPCGLCELLFRSERVLKNHRAIKHAEEREVPSEESEVNKSSYCSEGEEGSGKEDSPEESSGDSGADHGARRRRFTCPSCPFSCYQERAMDTHRRKGCMKPGELQCGLCSFVCKSAAALKHHVRLHGKRACRRRPRLSCELCPFTCKQLRCLQQHIAIKHDGVKPHKCSYCDFSTTRRYRLDAHESLHTGVGRLACDACQQTFGTGSKLRIHKLRVHEKRPTHFCALCDYSGYNQNDITRHASSCHAGEPSAACGRCQARFSSAGALKQHCLRRHEERGGHGCPSCVFACRSRSTLRSHVQRQHPQLVCAACKQHFPGREELEEHRKVHFGHRCQHCPFATRERQQLIQHLLDRHEEEGGEGGGGKPFRCPFCSFACRHQLVFDYHMKAHGGTRLYKCTDCDYTTKNRQKITWHIRIHTGEKPYKCHLCNYACADPSRLKYHMRIHQEERKYLCPDCGYKCKWINQLKYHMTKHTGAKPYQCDQCEYCTNRADALRTHKETRHKETRSFICEQCGKGFKTRFLLKTHLKKHSEEKPYVCSVCHRGFRWQAGLRHHHLTHTNQHPFFCRHCSYKAKQKFQVVKHIQRHHPLKASGNPSEGVGKVPVTHALGTCDGGTAEPLDSAGVNGLVSSS